MKILRRNTCYSGDSVDNKNLGGAFVVEYNNEFFVGIHDDLGLAFFIRRYETCLEAGLIFREVLDYCVKVYHGGDRKLFWLKDTDTFMFKEGYANMISKMVELGSENAKSERREIGEGTNINPRIIEIMTQ
jgi:hypothetical protein